MAISSMMGAALSGLQTAQAGLTTTSNNITNVNTPGYVKRSAVLESRAVLPGSDGGVDVAEIQRAFDSFTYSQVLTEH